MLNIKQSKTKYDYKDKKFLNDISASVDFIVFISANFLCKMLKVNLEKFFNHSLKEESLDELLFLVTMYFRIGNAKKGIPFLSNRYFHAVRIKIDRLFVFAVRVFDFHFILSVKAAESKLACIGYDFF